MVANITTNPFVSSVVETPIRRAHPIGLSTTLEANGLLKWGHA